MIIQLNLSAIQLTTIISFIISFVFMMVAIFYMKKAKKWEKEFWELKKLMDQLELQLNERCARIQTFIDKR